MASPALQSGRDGGGWSRSARGGVLGLFAAKTIYYSLAPGGSPIVPRPGLQRRVAWPQHFAADGVDFLAWGVKGGAGCRMLFSSQRAGVSKQIKGPGLGCRRHRL